MSATSTLFVNKSSSIPLNRLNSLLKTSSDVSQMIISRTSGKKVLKNLSFKFESGKELHQMIDMPYSMEVDTPIWKSVRYGVSKGLDTAYWGFLGAWIRRIFHDGYGILVFRITLFDVIRGTVQNKVDRETRFNNDFDQFAAELGEALVSVYNRFAQLMNDLERNGIKFPKVTINTKFLNCLQPEWLKYVTQVRLAKRLTNDSYDDLFEYISQYEKLINTSRAKKLEKSHDPLALVAHTGSSSRTPSPYYVTHPSSVIEIDDDY
ncbi:hypothetical protein Tco_0098419 [Tanacetum coccineum]